jgi:hypothetical protein
MDSTITLPWIAVIAVFLFGVVVGWFAANKVGANVSLGAFNRPPVELLRSGGSRLVKTTRTVVLKCQCGATWQFRDGTGSLPPGVEPIPTGDSFTCKKCGRTIDLKVERQLEAKALASVKPQNKV